MVERKGNLLQSLVSKKLQKYIAKRASKMTSKTIDLAKQNKGNRKIGFKQQKYTRQRTG
jgi:hypothetical protein